jgi:murein L,D-transpeptidase YafK
MARVGGVSILGVAGLLLASSHAARGTDELECPSLDPTVVVSVAEHELRLCENGYPVASFPVSIGHKGAGKHDAHDGKTPLGAYALGTPRPSAKFGTFIPIGYPTDEQRRAGYRGSDVGIHGPRRGLRWLGRLNTWLDWTQGCVALADDESLARVVAWMKRARPRLVHIQAD